MGDQFVFVPCRLDRRDAQSALFDDADGWPIRVVSPLGRYRGRLCVAGRWVREAGGRHLVRFADGQDAWVVYGPGRREEFEPLAWGSRSGAAAPSAAGAQTEASSALDQ